MTITEIKDTIIAAAMVCVVVAAHDIALHLTYGGRASAWRPTRPLPVISPAQADQIRR